MIGTFRLAIAHIGVLLMVANACAQQPPSETHTAAAVELLEMTNARAMTDQMLQTAREQLHTQIPGMHSIPGIDSLLDEMLMRRFSWDTLQSDLVRIYVDVFSEAELREITAFYQTELGQKMLRRMPELYQRAMALEQERLQREMPKMMEEMDATIKAYIARSRKK